ncbi:hypothetical protein MaudCBS49596_005039 [Microsporum audouinii]
MAAVVLAIGAAIYFTAEKIHDHREKKRALKAKHPSKHALLEDDQTIEDLPAYHKEKLPAYDMVDQHRHPALVSSEQTAGSSRHHPHGR